MGTPTTFTEIIEEKSNFKYTGTLKDEAGVLVTTLDSLTLTLYDEDSKNIVNSRNAQDILNANNGTFSSGVITFNGQPADSTPVDQTKGTVVHRAMFDASWNAGAGRRPWEVRFIIRNLVKLV